MKAIVRHDAPGWTFMVVSEENSALHWNGTVAGPRSRSYEKASGWRPFRWWAVLAGKRAIRKVRRNKRLAASAVVVTDD